MRFRAQGYAFEVNGSGPRAFHEAFCGLYAVICTVLHAFRTMG